MVHGPMLGRFRLLFASVVLVSAVSTILPAGAAETLYPQFFWRAPPGPNPERPLIITAGAAYPDGGLAVAGYREGEQEGEIERERYLYRIDAAGKTMWELKIETGDGIIGTLVRDARDGLVFCGGQNKVRRVDAEGRLDWVAAEWKSPAGEFKYPYLHDYNDCNALLAFPDGSVIVAGTLFDSFVYPTVRVTRIDPAGRTIWSSDMPVHAPEGEGRVVTLTGLPDGGVEVVFDPRLPLSNAHPPFLESPAFWEWRISPEGRWRPKNKMQRDVPLRGTWYGIAAFYRVRDGLVRVGDPADQDCRMAFEEWSLDGQRLLARGFLPPLGRCEGSWDTGYSDYGRSLAVPRDLDPAFLATVQGDIPVAWYRWAPPASVNSPHRFNGIWPGGQLPRGRRIYLFGDDPSEIYVVDLPL